MMATRPIMMAKMPPMTSTPQARADRGEAGCCRSVCAIASLSFLSCLQRTPIHILCLDSYSLFLLASTFLEDVVLSAPGHLLFSGPKLGEQPQNVDIDPDQREHQPEGGVPLHVPRRARLRCLLDEVEILAVSYLGSTSRC